VITPQLQAPSWQLCANTSKLEVHYDLRSSKRKRAQWKSHIHIHFSPPSTTAATHLSIDFHHILLTTQQKEKEEEARDVETESPLPPTRSRSPRDDFDGNNVRRKREDGKRASRE
jgi:hypothetical protein